MTVQLADFTTFISRILLFFCLGPAVQDTILLCLLLLFFAALVFAKLVQVYNFSHLTGQLSFSRRKYGQAI